MRRNRSERVQIQKPPVEELNKHRSCLKRTCITGAGCIVLFFIGVLLLVQFLIGPNTSTLERVPQSFIGLSPVYDISNVEHIVVIEGKDRHRGIEFLAYIPKLILSPIVLALDDTLAIESENQGIWQTLKQFVSQPITDQRDTIILTWTDLKATPKFITEYYIHELESNGYAVRAVKKGTNTIELTFTKNDQEGRIQITDEVESDGTDLLEYTITLENIY